MRVVNCILKQKVKWKVKMVFFFKGAVFFFNELNEMAISFKLFKIAYRTFIWSPGEGLALEICAEKFS